MRLPERVKRIEEIYYAGQFYEVAEIKVFPHGKMIGIFDEPPSKHIDYLNPENVSEVYPCFACQGGGCTVCNGHGKLIR